MRQLFVYQLITKSYAVRVEAVNRAKTHMPTPCAFLSVVGGNLFDCGLRDAGNPTRDFRGQTLSPDLPLPSGIVKFWKDYDS